MRLPMIIAVAALATTPPSKLALETQFRVQALLRAIEDIPAGRGEVTCLATEAAGPTWVDPDPEIVQQVVRRFEFARPVSQCSSAEGLYTVSTGPLQWRSQDIGARIVIGSVSLFRGRPSLAPAEWVCPVVGIFTSDGLILHPPKLWLDKTCGRVIRLAPIEP